MSGSPAEREIRDAVAGWFRTNLPAARVVHELVVGQCRADIAAVEPERLILVEIKSAKDKLGRLERQVQAFERAGHDLVVVAHQRWYESNGTYHDGRPRFRPCDGLKPAVNSRSQLWRYPEVEGSDANWFDRWRLDKATTDQPHARALLSLLWRAELQWEASRHGIVAGSRATCDFMIREMAYHMTGREIAQAVCRRLRGRAFPEADAPIIDRIAA